MKYTLTIPSELLNVVRDIEVQIEKLKEADEFEFIKLNFEPEKFKSGNNKVETKYDLSEDAFALVVMAYVTDMNKEGVS